MKTNFKCLCISISWEKVESASYFASKHYFLETCFSSFLEKYFKLKYLLLRMTCHNWFVEIFNQYQYQITKKQKYTLIFSNLRHIMYYVLCMQTFQ